MHDFYGLNIESFFKEHYRPLCLYATHIVSDADKAEDAVMECFAGFISKVEEGWKPNDAKKYIYMMVRNRCVDEMKHSRHVADVELIGDVADTDDHILEMMECCEREARLWKAIDELPKSRRQIFLMSKRDGMSYKEIAANLGLSVKTVEKQISNAYSALRSKAESIYNKTQGENL